MDYRYDNFLDDELIDECEQVRSIAKKSWLSSASVSLAHLDNVKAKVYNFGLADPKDLKGTNLITRRAPSSTDNLSTEPPLSNTAVQQISSSVAWGSNNSIPDLMKQHPTLPKPTRPASAKYNNTRSRPPSGKKNRPQSAKEPLPQSHDDAPGLGVKGAKYDPNGRPPKGLPNGATTGWVGPPAGLKYPDKPSQGGDWQMEFPIEEDEDSQMSRMKPSYMMDHEIPPAPQATPTPPSPEPVEEKTKRVFELYIGDPYKNDSDDDYIQEDSDEEEFAPPTPLHGNQSDTATSHSQAPISTAPSPGLVEKESLKLSLPTMDDDYDEIDEMDTERLLAEAESVSQKFDLKGIINANKHIPESSTNHTLETDSNLSYQSSEMENEFNQSNKKRAEDLVSKIINDSGLDFKRDEKKSSIQKVPVLDHEKSSVKFNEDVRTVSITPRNIGRKVEELHQHSKKKTSVHKENNFVDLIEMKNRIEPVLSTGKIEMPSGRNRPPSGKSKGTKQVNQGSNLQSCQASGDKGNRHERAVSPTGCNKIHSSLNRPRSATGPLNRVARPITTVTVDYGPEKLSSNKTKKAKQKYEDIETMMEKIILTETEVGGHKGHSEGNRGSGKCSQNDEVDLEEAELMFDNTFVPTVCKSEPEKNYYEISRHSSMSNVSRHSSMSNVSRHSSMSNNPNHSKMSKVPTKEREGICNDDAVLYNGADVNQGQAVFKTTKTIEFDELKPKEVSVRSVIDPQVLLAREKEKFLSSAVQLDGKDGGRGRVHGRPSSAKPPVSKKPTLSSENEGRSSSLERPGSRLGFFADSTSDKKSKSLHRPSSAPVRRQPKSAQTDKENKEKPNKAGDVKTELTEVEKAEREKVIDNLLERTGHLLEDTEKKEVVGATLTGKKKVRPASAHVGLVSRSKEQKRITSAVMNKRPMSATVTRPTHRHYASYSRSSSAGTQRKTSSKTRTVLTEPCIINTNTSYFEEETEEDLACQELHKQMSDKGVNIAAETLQRALYPPSGKSKYYQITADLPKKPSLSLLSHPSVWLPEEYKRLQKAEKTLSRANEIMFLQKKAEERRAKLAALGPEERKKLKKKGKKGGKKGGKKLRKSLTVG